MKVRVVCVGKPRDRGLAALHDRYAERIRKLGAPYETAFVPEVKAGGRYSEEHAREREGRALLAALESSGTTIALDRSGEMLDTEELARRLESWSVPQAAFVIGGPSGLHSTVLERTHRAWSLSRLTFPHELVRVLLVEQLYRALTLLRGVPYHK